jgi:hypothetical protein
MKSSFGVTALLSLVTLGGVGYAPGAIQGVLRGNAYEVMRSIQTFAWNTITTVVATAIWTPTAGKKFRLMGGAIIFSSGLLAAGLQTIELQDAAASIPIIFKFQCYQPIAASILGVGTVIPFSIPNGYLSSAVNNVLNAIMNSASTAGGNSVTVWGCEE